MLKLDSGRRYVLAEVGPPAGGWWFTARAEDGSTVLTGNLRLVWEQAAQEWRAETPVGLPSPARPSGTDRRALRRSPNRQPG